MKPPNGNEEDKPAWHQKITGLFRSAPKTTEDMVAIVDAASENEVIDNDAKRIIEGALEVSEMHAREIMIPRTQMTVLKAEDSFEENLDIIIKSAHSRYPVVGESMDEVLGILLAKDLLPLIRQKNGGGSITDVLRPAVFVPESKRLNVLLKQFREDRDHMALVIDEYGTLAGLVTIEDVLEEIVGEIEDEHDRDVDEYIQKMSSNNYMVNALTPIDDFNDYFSTKLDDSEFDTIGGIVINQFGHVPKRNEETEFEGFHIKVMRADNRKLISLRLSRDSEKNSDSNTSTPAAEN